MKEKESDEKYFRVQVQGATGSRSHGGTWWWTGGTHPGIFSDSSIGSKTSARNRQKRKPRRAQHEGARRQVLGSLLGQAALLALPEVEIEKVRMRDVPASLMKRLVDQSIERRGRPTLDVSRQISILEQAVRELKGGDSLTAEALVSTVHDALKSFHSGRPL